MKNKILEKLDATLKDKKEREEKAAPFLTKQALVIEKIDNQIEYYEKKIVQLEKVKLAELEVMQELFDTAVISFFSLNSGFTVGTSLSRKMKIANISTFLIWLKNNCTPKEVLEFFDDSLKSTVIKKFVEKQCDKQRKAGEIAPKVDGIDLGDVNYRRLTTYRGEIKK